MKKIFFTFLFCLMTQISFADPYYVFIDKKGGAGVQAETGHTEKGDVVAIYPVTEQFEPTRAELQRFHIVIVDLTEIERVELLEKVTTTVEVKNPKFLTESVTQEKILKARKRKVDYEQFQNTNQKAVIFKSAFMDRITLKP